MNNAAAPGGAIVLEGDEGRSTFRVQRHHLAVDHTIVRHQRKGVYYAWVTGVEVDIIPRAQVYSTASLDRQCPIAVKFQLMEPFRAVREFLCAQKQHRVDERGFGLFLVHVSLKDNGSSCSVIRSVAMTVAAGKLVRCILSSLLITRARSTTGSSSAVQQKLHFREIRPVGRDGLKEAV
jgi:hypothetical protein